MAKIETTLLIITLASLAVSLYPGTETVARTVPNETSVPILAVDQSGKGVVGRAYVRTVNASGMAFVDLSGAFPDAEAQASAAAAAKAASLATGADYGLAFRLSLPSHVAAGPSAGAALAVAAAAALRGIEVDESIAITGGIDENGYLTAASGIIEKARAAKAAGFVTLLIPLRGGPDLPHYEKSVRCAWADGVETCSTVYSADVKSIHQLTGIEVKTVENLAEALDSMSGGNDG